MSLRAWSSIAALGLAWTCSVAQAQESVEIEVDGCPERARRDFLAVFPIEVSGLGPEVSDWVTESTPRVRFQCSQEAALLSASFGEASLSHELSAERIQSAGFGRLAALEAVELLVALHGQMHQEPEAGPADEESTGPPASSLEPVESPSPSRSPEEPSEQEPAAAPNSGDRQRVSLRLGLEAGAWIGGIPALVGPMGRVWLDIAPLPMLVFGLGVDVFGLERDVSAGSVRLRHVSAALHGAARLRLGLLGYLDLGAGYRAGAVFFAGVPDTGFMGQQATLGWSGPLVVSRVALHFAPIFLGLTLEAGLVLRPARAEVIGEPEISIERGWITISVGIGLCTF